MNNIPLSILQSTKYVQLYIFLIEMVTLYIAVRFTTTAQVFVKALYGSLVDKVGGLDLYLKVLIM